MINAVFWKRRRGFAVLMSLWQHVLSWSLTAANSPAPQHIHSSQVDILFFHGPPSPALQHSGVYGGSIAEAMQDVVKLLATLNNNDGSIAVKGISDDVRPFTVSSARVVDAPSVLKYRFPPINIGRGAFVCCRREP